MGASGPVSQPPTGGARATLRAVSALSTAGRWFLKHRRRLAPGVIVIGAAAVGGQLVSALPRDLQIRYSLGPSHGDVVEARIAYWLDGQELKGARFQWGEGAPATVRHTVELAPGRYEIRADLVETSRVRSVRRALRVPAEGEVRIDLYEGVGHDERAP